MSTIIQNAEHFLQLSKEMFPRKIHPLFEFGFKTLSLQRIVSLNTNARSTVENAHTAESKAYRLTKNKRFVPLFPRLIVHLGLIHDHDIVAVDFSDFGIIHVLMFGKQTKRGRTVPLYFKIIIYPIQKGSENIFIIRTIEEFLKAIRPRTVRFVFDRGFARPAIIEYLADIPVIFYLRIKRSKKVMYQGQRLSAKEFSEGVYQVHAYDVDLSLTITPLPSRRKGKKREPWYIISNDLTASAEAIQSVYYYRFEIEELFRDAKRMFGLEYIHFAKPDNFATVLWFVMLGMWFHAYLENHVHEAKTRIKTCKQSFNQSITHYWLEQIRYALQAPVLALISIADG